MTTAQNETTLARVTVGMTVRAKNVKGSPTFTVTSIERLQRSVYTLHGVTAAGVETSATGGLASKFVIEEAPEVDEPEVDEPEVDGFDAWAAEQGEPATVLVDGDEVVPSSDEERAELVEELAAEFGNPTAARAAEERRRVDALEAKVEAAKRAKAELLGRLELEQDLAVELEGPGGTIGDEVLLGAGAELYGLELRRTMGLLEVRVRFDRLGTTRYGWVVEPELRRALESPRIGQPARRFGPREVLELERPLEGHRIDETSRHQYAGLAEARVTRLPAGIEVELLELAPGSPPAAKVVTYAITTRNRDRTVLLVRLAELEAAVGATFEAPTAAECAR